MDSKTLYELIETELLPKCFEIMKSKGESYSGLEDKLGNFKRCAKLAGVSVEKAVLVYMIKHIDAISSYCRGEYSDCEKIEGRIQDAINYLFLLYGIIKEQGDKKDEQK